MNMNQIKLRLVTSGAFAIAVGLAASASASGVKISKSKFTYSGVSYFRGKAENVNLASYGEKKTPIGKPNYLAIQGDVARSNLAKVRVKMTGPYSIEWSKFSDSSVNLGINYLTVAGGTAGFSRKAAKSANLKLVKFAIDERPLKTLLNKHAPVARKEMAKEGKDARIVSEVWVVMAASLASDVTSCGTVSGQGTANGIKVELSGSSCTTNKSSITIPKNTTFAYKMHKVKKWSKGKKSIEDMEDDTKGMN